MHKLSRVVFLYLHICTGSEVESSNRLVQMDPGAHAETSVKVQSAALRNTELRAPAARGLCQIHQKKPLHSQMLNKCIIKINKGCLGR